MVRGVRDRATSAPGYGSFSNVVFNPTADLAIQKMFDVNALSDLGIRFPFNNGSVAVANITSNTTLSPTKGVLYYDELNISNGAVVGVGASPCFIFARKVSIAAGCVLHADGRGAAGGSGPAGGIGGYGGSFSQAATAGAGGSAGNAGQQADYGATVATDPPQFNAAITSGGGGGSAGGGAGGRGNGSIAGAAGGAGLAAGDGGRGAAVYPGGGGGGASGTAGAAGGTASAGGSGGAGTAGTAASASPHARDLLRVLMDYFLSHRGGGAGGGGSSGAGGGGGGGNGDHQRRHGLSASGGADDY